MWGTVGYIICVNEKPGNERKDCPKQDALSVLFFLQTTA